jgi:2-polyprenyl-3-methyl-5-hydroxy-6-metoxy-1,4-benzoquinol methylase
MVDNKLYTGKDEDYYSYSRPELLKFIPSDIKSVLDIGCGEGSFGELLKSKGNYTVWGIEYDSKAAVKAENKLDKVINADFDSSVSSLAGQKFDLICFNDVLEHLVNPVETLIKCKELLTGTGYILASIPNIRWYPVVLSLLRYKDFKYQEAGVMDKSHLRFFTKKSIIRLFEETGYEILEIEGINKSKFKYFDIINALLLKSQSDMSYPQFAVISTVKT